MLLGDIREKAVIKPIPRIIGEWTYKAIHKLRELMHSDASDIPTTLRGGFNGHIGLLIDSSVFLTSLQLPTQGQQSQSYIYNMGKATQQLHHPTQMKSISRGGEYTTSTST